MKSASTYNDDISSRDNCIISTTSVFTLDNLFKCEIPAIQHLRFNTKGTLCTAQYEEHDQLTAFYLKLYFSCCEYLYLLISHHKVFPTL
jgi:hypothetical protein